MERKVKFTKNNNVFNKIIKFYRENENVIITGISIAIIVIVGILLKNNIQHLKHLMNNKSEIKEILTNFGPLGPIVLVVFQILQVVIFFIPGEVFQTAAGYAYGTWIGTLLCIVGIDIGSIVLFVATKKYGSSLVDKFVPKKVSDYFYKLLQSEKINFIVFLIYLVPGIPKDGSIFLCGLSKINLRDFLIYSTLGRLPALIISCYYGANLALGNTKIIIVITILFFAIVAVSYFFKENIYKRLQGVS